MTLRLIIGIVIGMGLGALMGYFGKCSSGACPLTANPYRGAIYGGLMGALIIFSFAGSTKQPEGKVSPAGSTEAGTQPQVGNVVHVNNEADFNRYVVHATMPCLADFYSDNCGPCRRLAPTIEELAEKYHGRAVICKVSLDAAPGLAQPHRITGIPAVLFFDKGRELQRVVGLHSRTAYESVLNKLLSKQNNAEKDASKASF